MRNSTLLDKTHPDTIDVLEARAGDRAAMRRFRARHAGALRDYCRRRWGLARSEAVLAAAAVLRVASVYLAPRPGSARGWLLDVADEVCRQRGGAS